MKKIFDEGLGKFIYLTKKEYLEAFNNPYVHEDMSNREHYIADTF